MSSSALFDMLGIDEAEGIDPDEVEAIKNTLTRIKVVAGSVAKHNDAPQTLAILRAMEDAMRRVSGVTSIDELHAGLAKDSTGTPARALGTGAKTPEEAALETILNSSTTQIGLKMALKRMSVPSDPDYIRVEDDGTPSEIKALRAQVATLTTERDTHKDGASAFIKLLDAIERETGLKPNPGEGPVPFMQRVKAKLAAGAVPPDSVKKADIQPLLDEVEKAAGRLKSGRMTTDIEGKPALDTAIEKAREAVKP